MNDNLKPCEDCATHGIDWPATLRIGAVHSEGRGGLVRCRYTYRDVCDACAAVALHYSLEEWGTCASRPRG